MFSVTNDLRHLVSCWKILPRHTCDQMAPSCSWAKSFHSLRSLGELGLLSLAWMFIEPLAHSLWSLLLLLLQAPLLQHPTHPHGHHLGIPIIVLDDKKVAH